MRLYLLRHGHAPSITEAKVGTDAERPISPQGREAVAASARYLVEKGARPALILHSPLRRAVETAQAAAAILKPREGVEAFPALANALPAEELLKALKDRLKDREEAVAVGHQPQLGELAALLTGQLYELRPGGLIALDADAAPMPRALWTRNPS